MNDSSLKILTVLIGIIAVYVAAQQWKLAR